MIRLNWFAGKRNSGIGHRAIGASIQRNAEEEAAYQAELERQLAEQTELMSNTPYVISGEKFRGNNQFVAPTGGLYGTPGINRVTYSFVQPKTPSKAVGTYGNLNNSTIADPARTDDAWAEQKAEQTPNTPAEQAQQQTQIITPQQQQQPAAPVQQPQQQPVQTQTVAPTEPTQQVQQQPAPVQAGTPWEQWNNQMTEIVSSERNKKFMMQDGKAPPAETTDGELDKLVDVGAHTYQYNENAPDHPNIDPNAFYTGCTVEELEEIYPELIDVDESGTKTINGPRAGLVALSLLGEVARRLGRVEDLVYVRKE